MPSQDVTMLLEELRTGAPGASERLLEAVYAELRGLAGSKMARERRGHTLQATALVHEAFLRLVDEERRPEDRAKFFSAAAIAMERVLIDHARARAAQKRGSGEANVTLDELRDGIEHDGFRVIELHEVLAELEKESPEFAEVVRYRYFLGMSLEQIAPLMGTSTSSLSRRWAFARAWLLDRLGD
ncbi:MAG: ECF-type sigma factor [Planctomycetota bacterium]